MIGVNIEIFHNIRPRFRMNFTYIGNYISNYGKSKDYFQNYHNCFILINMLMKIAVFRVLQNKKADLELTLKSAFNISTILKSLHHDST